jgi:predicted choloylglycine hydrolase
MNEIQWQFFPKSKVIPTHLKEVVDVFGNNFEKINSDEFTYSSNEVLGIVASSLEKNDYKVEKSKKSNDKIKVPVLFGPNGKLEKYFDADGYNEITKTVIEVEAGRAVTNYQFLKDLFQACMMYEVDYLIIAVRKTYLKNQDFKTVITFFDTLYSSGRLRLPLEGILIIGY